MLELVGAWCYLCGNQALLCFMKISESILMCLVEQRAPIPCSAFRKLLHLQMKVAFLLHSSMLEVTLYLLI